MAAKEQKQNTYTIQQTKNLSIFQLTKRNFGHESGFYCCFFLVSVFVLKKIGFNDGANQTKIETKLRIRTKEYLFYLLMKTPRQHPNLYAKVCYYLAY